MKTEHRKRSNYGYTKTEGGAVAAHIKCATRKRRRDAYDEKATVRKFKE